MKNCFFATAHRDRCIYVVVKVFIANIYIVGLMDCLVKLKNNMFSLALLRIHIQLSGSVDLLKCDDPVRMFWGVSGTAAF